MSVSFVYTLEVEDISASDLLGRTGKIADLPDHTEIFQAVVCRTVKEFIFACDGTVETGESSTLTVGGIDARLGCGRCIFGAAGLVWAGAFVGEEGVRGIGIGLLALLRHFGQKILLAIT